MKPKLLMIDNYDSFTYNLVQYFSELGCQVVVYRNDKISIAEINNISPSYIVLSPGPCTPNEAGICLSLIKQLHDRYPILGVCLGHQCIAQAFGGKITHADKIMHGKVSDIIHDSKGIYAGIPSPLSVTRYHSLVAEIASLPDCLTISSYELKDDGSKGEIMSFHHKDKPIYGLQYHPESILTKNGKKILNNFLNMRKIDRINK